MRIVFGIACEKTKQKKKFEIWILENCMGYILLGAGDKINDRDWWEEAAVETNYYFVLYQYIFTN